MLARIQRMPRRTKLLSAITAALVIVLGSAFAFVRVAHADNTAFYINNQSGANCNDSNAGTDPNAPWCDFTPVNNHGAFGPGDQILLARGATWNQELDVTGSGSSSAHATIDAYGSGDRPKIIRDGGGKLERGVLLTDPSFWDVNNLEVGSAAVGIEAYFDTLSHDTLRFNNDYLHNIEGIQEANQTGTFTPYPKCVAGDPSTNTLDGIYESAGIAISGPSSLVFGPTDYALTNLSLTNIEGTHNQVSADIEFCNGVGATDGNDGHNLIQNVTMSGLNFHQDDGGGNAAGCPEGLGLGQAEHVLVQNSVFNGEGGCYTQHGTTAIILGRLADATLSNNTIENVPSTGSPDQTGTDFEAATNEIHILNNTYQNNAGAGIEILAYYQDNGTGVVKNINADIGGNTFSNDGTATSATYGSIIRIGTVTTPTGTIHDNTYSEPTEFAATGCYDGCGNYDGFTLSNNNPLTSVTAAFNRYFNNGIRDHWVTTGSVTAGYNLESTQGYLYTTQQSGTVPLYGCLINSDHFISNDANCEGYTVLRTEGYIYSSQPSSPATVALYRCFTGSDHFVSGDPTCEGQQTEYRIGYALSNG